MHLARALPTTTFLLLARWVAVQSGFPVGRAMLFTWFESLGILAIGWGVGVTGWLIAGHPATLCFFRSMPRAWGLWRRDVLTSSLPVYKYLLGGLLLLGLGTVLARQLWGFWTPAFDAGLLAGGIVGVIHSFAEVRKVGGQIDFLEANQRYLNEEKISLFTEYEKP